MINFVRRHRVLTILSSLIVIVVLVIIFAGQTIWNNTIEQISQYRSRSKTVCTVNPQNAAQVVYEV